MSMYIDIKFLHAISYRLENFKKKSNDLWNCRCPICGDSSRKKNKARGYFFLGKADLQYKCHNCGVSMSFGNFLKQFDTNQYGQFVVEKYAHGNKAGAFYKPETKSMDNVKDQFDFTPKINKPARLIDSIMDRLDSLPTENEAVQYATSRRLPITSFDRLYFIDNIKHIVGLNEKYRNSILTSEPRLAIPFFDRSGKLTAVSLRAMRGESLRYILVKVDEDAPTVFGLDKIDIEKDIFVVEGPLDSLFLDNCIACAGTSFNKISSLPIPKDKVTIIFDNQPKNKEVVKLIGDYIKQNYRVVIWPDSLPGKDINELILSGMSADEIKSIINHNTFCGLSATARFTMWRKV